VRALRTLVVAVVAVSAVGAAGCHRDRCTPICEQRAKELGCHPNDPCKTTCEKLHTAPACRKELLAFERCFLARPTADWECDVGDGTPVIHQNLCLDERRGVVTCLENTPRPPQPPQAH
jgi:hypothetical protein